MSRRTPEEIQALTRWFADRPHSSEQRTTFTVTVIADTGEVLTEHADDWFDAVAALRDRVERAARTQEESESHD